MSKLQTVFLGGLIFFSQSFLFFSVNAEIFKCVDVSGRTFYNDKSCPKTDSETKIKAVKDPVGGYIPEGLPTIDNPENNSGVSVGGAVDESNVKSKTENDASESQDRNSEAGTATGNKRSGEPEVVDGLVDSDNNKTELSNDVETANQNSSLSNIENNQLKVISIELMDKPK